MDTIFYGIRRLILLNTASYSLGDFPLDRALSISAPNNRGKSTAINALQFPFLSNINDMAFPRSNEDTRRYYFPYENSYVISEIITDTGSYVVGASGKGQASGYEYQLFAYKAKLELQDYFVDSQDRQTDKQIRNFKELSTHLGRQGTWVKALTPKQMRDALMGKIITLKNDEKFTIGVFRLISMTDVNYRLFIRVFKNLLHMNNVNLEEMKHLLIDVLLPGQGSTSIDFMARYRILNEEVDQANGRVNTAIDITNDVKKLEQAVVARDENIGILRTLFPRITSLYVTELDKQRTEIESIQEKIISIEPRINDLIASQDPLQEKIQTHAIEEAELKTQLLKIEQDENKYALYPSEMELNKQIAVLNDDLEHLIGTLRRSHPEDLKGIQTDLKDTTIRLKDITARIFAIDNNLLFILSEHFGEPQIQTLLKLFNRDLLTVLPLGERGFSIIQEKKLLEGLRNVLSKCKKGVYDDGRVRISLDAIPDVDVDAYFDYDLIKEQQEHLQRRKEQLEEDHKAALDYKEKEKKKNELAVKIDMEKHNLNRYSEYLENKSKKPQLEKELLRITALLNESKRDLGEISNKLLALGEQKHVLLSEQSNKEAAMARLSEKYQRVIPCSESEPLGIEPKHKLPTQLEDMIDTYLLAHENHKHTNEQIDMRLTYIENKNGLRFTSGQDLNNTIRELIEAVQRIDDYKKLRDESQKAVSQEIGALLKGLRERYTSFELEIRRFNRQMNSKKISNIKNIEFILDNDNDIYSTIETLVDQDDLFTDAEKVHRAVRDLDRKITQKGLRLSLDCLFNLGILVELENNKVTRNFNDANIQSTGTGLTVKVILNVMLLKRLLFTKKGQVLNIPVYIDEAGQIDPSNQHSLIEQCIQSGFVPIFASVEPQASADYWIGLKEFDGRIFVDQSDWFRLEQLDDKPQLDDDA